MMQLSVYPKCPPTVDDPMLHPDEEVEMVLDDHCVVEKQEGCLDYTCPKCQSTVRLCWRVDPPIPQVDSY